MNIANATSVGAIVNSPQPAPTRPEKPAETKQDSAVVKLSDRAQQLNKSDDQNKNTERSESKPQQNNAEPPGIQFITSYDKGGKVSAQA
jgi:hypothetical protein